MAESGSNAKPTENEAESSSAADQPVAESERVDVPEPVAPRAQPARTIVKARAVRTGVARRRIKAVSGRTTSKKGTNEMTKQTKEAVDTGLFAAEQIKAAFGDVNERARSAIERSAKLAEEVADLTRGNVEAFVASSKAAATGVETLSQEAADYGRRSFEEASAALKNVGDVKSATDFFKLQSDYARGAFDTAVAESARLSETFIKVAGDVAEPLTSRYTVAAERVKNLAA
jgi:phasin family protein